MFDTLKMMEQPDEFEKLNLKKANTIEKILVRGLERGDEKVLDFLKSEIYPEYNSLSKEISEFYAQPKEIKKYFGQK